MICKIYAYSFSPFQAEFNQEAHSIVKNWLKVEGESEQIKDKVNHTKKATKYGIASGIGRPKTAKNGINPKKEDIEDDAKIALE